MKPVVRPRTNKALRIPILRYLSCGDRDTSSVDSCGLSISISITLSNGVDNRGSIESVEAGVGSESSEEGRAVGGGVGSIVQRSSSVHNLRFRLSEGNSGQSENSKHLHVESVQMN